MQEILKSLVDDGTITQDQADKVVAALVAAGPVGFPGGHRGFGGPGKVIGAGIDVVATTLGITEDEVRTALESGQSIADLAVSKGKTAQDVIDAIVAEATTRINAAVTDGKLTQERADELIANLTTRVTELVNSTPPLGGPGLGLPGFGGPRHHRDANDADDEAPADTTSTRQPRPIPSPAEVLGSAGMASSLVIPAGQNNDVSEWCMYECACVDR